jgi:septal ring factor EnvC (AmiA/AmiB activator)
MMASLKSNKAFYLISFVVVISVFFTVGLVYAAGGGGGGMDKTKDLIARTMNFVVLVGALVFLLKKPLAKALEARRQGIREQLDDLEKQKLNAEAELKEYKDKLARLEQELDQLDSLGGVNREIRNLDTQLEEVREEIEEIILKALAPEVPDRYQQVGQLLDDLGTASEIDHRASRMEDIRQRLKAREPTPAGFCWNCRKALHSRALNCPFCGEKQ